MELNPTIQDRGDRKPLSRREFLYNLWASSMAVFMAGSGGVFVWFALPRFKASEFGGVFTIPVGEIPPVDAPPKGICRRQVQGGERGEGRINATRQPDDYPLMAGIRALYKVCTHLGCLYKWSGGNDRFECPCHGSKYLQTGARIDGPARRNLDVFMIEAVDEEGKVLARTEPSLGNREGTALSIPAGTIELRIDTGRRILGGTSTSPGGGM